MSGVSATGVGVSCPSKLTKHTQNFQRNPNLLSSISTPNRGGFQSRKKHICRAHYSSEIPIISLPNHQLSSNLLPTDPFDAIISHSIRLVERGLVPLLIDLDPSTAKLAIGILGPILSGFGFLFILRIVMSWYPKLPVDKFPYVIAYAPTEPVLAQTRKVIPPLGGVDITPVVCFALLSFLNEILLGPQGLLVLLSQQQV